jgi:hypothetical protein
MTHDAVAHRNRAQRAASHLGMTTMPRTRVAEPGGKRLTGEHVEEVRPNSARAGASPAALERAPEPSIPRVEVTPQARAAARRAIEAGMQFEFISGQADFGADDPEKEPGEAKN